jgi:predicted RecB family nuclease
MCQFRFQCETKAIQEDNLSRLKGATPKVIRQYEKKGIFTVKQLSYLFRPRKRKKRAKNAPATTHNIELQALAIRTGKIYLQERPGLTRQEIELFLDIESVPDQDVHYC